MTSQPLLRSLVLGVTLMTSGVPLLAEGPGGFTGGQQDSAGILYSVNQITGELVTIDPSTASIDVVGPTGFNLIEGLTYHAPTDSLLGVDNSSNQLVTINRHTGVGAALGPIGRDFVFGLTYSEQFDTLYAYDNLADELLTLDPTSGSVTGQGVSPFDFVGGLTDNPETGVLYGADFGNDRIFLIDLLGGLSGPIVDTGPSSLQGVAFDSTTGDLYAVGVEVGPDALMRVDPLSDTVELVGALGSGSFASLEFVPADAVPEPSTTCLIGAIVVTAAGRRPAVRCSDSSVALR